MCPVGPMGPILGFRSLGFCCIPLVSVGVLILCPLGFLFCLWFCSVLGPVDIFEFLLRKRVG